MTIPAHLKNRLAESDEQSRKIAELKAQKADRRKEQKTVEQDRRKGDRRGKR